MVVLSSNTSKLIAEVTGPMFDATLRRWIDTPIALAGRKLTLVGIGADTVSILGLVFGITSALAIVFGQFWIGLTLFLLSRLADGLDGAIARATAGTDRGGFLDIAFDFLVYAAIPLAFAIHNAHANALPQPFCSRASLPTAARFLPSRSWPSGAASKPRVMGSSRSTISLALPRASRRLSSSPPFAYGLIGFHIWQLCSRPCVSSRRLVA